MLERKAVSGITLALLLIGMLMLTYDVEPVKADAIYIRPDGTVDPSTAPISRIGEVYTFVDNIYDSIVVQRDNIVVDGAGYVLQGPGDQGPGEGMGIHLLDRSNVTLSNMRITAFIYGILLSESSDNTIIASEISASSWYGIGLLGSSNNNICENNITANNYEGIYACPYPSSGRASSHNRIVGNNITANIHSGIILSDSSSQYNIISGNNITANNDYGVNLIWSSNNNVIYHNNFIDNTFQASADQSNIWDNGYPSGGNYWSDYVTRYPDAHELDDSGIWDTPYVIEENNRDRYPLIHPFVSDPLPPSISNIQRTPVTPNYDEGVVVSAIVTDNVEVDQTLFFYTQDLSWHNVSMNKFGTLFNATIPAQPYGTLVQYEIYANDTDGNWAESELYSYVVGDFLAPEISLSKIPDYPLPGQKVKVYANVTEPANASGIKTPVLFSYRVNGGPWWDTTMIFNSGLSLYETTVPAYEKHDFVEYLVKAVDNAGNTNTTVVHHYEVLRCDVNHNGIVDVYDAYIIARAWGLKVGEQGYNPEADINEDGIIEHQDLQVVSRQYGKDP